MREKRCVFDVGHAKLFSLHRDGVIDATRAMAPERPQSSRFPRLWIVVEKMFAPDAFVRALHRVARADIDTRHIGLDAIKRTSTELHVQIDVYRTYVEYVDDRRVEHHHLPRPRGSPRTDRHETP